MKKIKVAFVKFGGLGAAGTERWLQMMAANLPRDEFDIDYYYCDSAPYVNSDYKHPDTDPDRLKYMKDNKVNLIKFKVGAKDARRRVHKWVNTNFWDVFNESKYDLVQTAKAGPKEYPFYLMKLPVVEYLTLGTGVDFSKNIACSVHLSQWQRARWGLMGGDLRKSDVIPIPAVPPCSKKNLRKILKIPDDALVAGFHQRADDNIFSSIPLEAFSKVQKKNRYFVIKGGGSKYREQAKKLGLKNLRFVEHSGSAESISEFLNTLDIFAHGRSDGETFGTVFAEAMMHELPCLSHLSEIANGHVETIGPAGFVAGDVYEYAEILDNLFENKKLREKLSKKGRIHAEQYYSLKSCVEKLSNVYRRICKVNEKPLSKELIPYGYSRLGFLYAGLVDKVDEIAHHVIAWTIPEAFDIYVAQYFLRNAKTVFDIGANTGLYCFVAANVNKNSKIAVFEPQTECLKYLKKTVELNNWNDKFVIVQKGLSSKKEEKTLHLSGSGSTFDKSFIDFKNVPGIKVSVDTLDNQVEELNIVPDFIKIDVEGHEFDVLRGAVKTIEKNKPVIFFEMADGIKNRKHKNANYSATISWLQNKEYRIFICKNWNLRQVNSSNKENISLCTCVCTRKNMPKKLQELKNGFLIINGKNLKSSEILSAKVLKTGSSQFWF